MYSEYVMCDRYTNESYIAGTSEYIWYIPVMHNVWACAYDFINIFCRLAKAPLESKCGG